MLALCERIVLVGGGWRIDDGGTAVTVAGGYEGGGHVIAELVPSRLAQLQQSNKETA
jgi:hypothetical protein